MKELPEAVAVRTGAQLAIPVNYQPAIQRGHVDVWLSAKKAGEPASRALFRQLVVQDGVVPDFPVYDRDVYQVWARNGKPWIVVSYAGSIVASGRVRLP